MLFSPIIDSVLQSRPRIEDYRAGGLEIFYVPGGHCHVVDKRCRGNQGIALRPGVWDMRLGASLCDGSIYGQNTSGKGWQYTMIEPSPENCTLLRVAPLDQQDPCFKFQ